MEAEEKLVIYAWAYEREYPAGTFGSLVRSAPADLANQARLQHRIGLELLKMALLGEYGIEISGDIQHQIERGSNGKPALKGLPIHFNISHCKGLAVCALAPCPVGVDAEGLRPVSEALLRRVCTPEEREYIAGGAAALGLQASSGPEDRAAALGLQASPGPEGRGAALGLQASSGPESRTGAFGIREERFLELWTLKESYLKMTGVGLRQRLDSVAFRFRGEEPGKTEQSRMQHGKEAPEKAGFLSEPESWLGPTEIACNQPGFFYQRKLWDQYILSVCTERECGEPELVINESAGNRSL